MIKLYLKRGDVTRYWEAWNTATEVTIHWGILGEMGETREIPLSGGEDANRIIALESKRPKNQGYRKIATSKLQRLVIQYRVDGMRYVEDLDKRQKIEHLMNECLGWKGLGFCDGGDIGGGRMNVFCFVVNAKTAAPHVLEKLEKSELLGEAVVAIGKKPEVVWPKD